MNTHQLNDYLPYLLIQTSLLPENPTSNIVISNPSPHSNKTTFPYFSIEDQLLSFFNEYYENHPEEKLNDFCLLHVDGKKSPLNPLFQAILQFLKTPRHLVSYEEFFTFKKILKFVNPDEIEWIGSSVQEFLAPYFYQFCLNHLLPKEDRVQQEQFKTQLDALFKTSRIQSILNKTPADWDLRLISQGNLETQNEKSQQILKFFHQKYSHLHQHIPFQSFKFHLSTNGCLAKYWIAKKEEDLNRYAIVGLNLKNQLPHQPIKLL